MAIITRLHVFHVFLSEILIVSIEAKMTSSTASGKSRELSKNPAAEGIKTTVQVTANDSNTASGKSRELSKQLALVDFIFVHTQIDCSCSRLRDREFLLYISVVAKLESA
jgi:hypothetical protein